MAIKAQALVEFIVKFTYSQSDESLDASAELTKGVEGKETRWKLYVNGSFNQNGCGTGLILQTHQENKWNTPYASDSKPPTMKYNTKLSSSDWELHLNLK